MPIWHHILGENHWGEKMGIKQTNVQSFLEPESVGFIYDTARSFLKRHSNPETLLAQLKDLFYGGEVQSCKELIQLIIEEQHSLSESGALFLLRAQIAFEQSDDPMEYIDWVKQAQLCSQAHQDLDSWNKLIRAQKALKEADYVSGQEVLEALIIEGSSVSSLASYLLAHHLFWRNINTDRALDLLEEVTNKKSHFVKAWACLGFVYNKLQYKDKAQFAFGQCIEFESNPEKLKFYKQQLAS